MAGSREIRNKIKSVKNTQKITRAMEMVAASKMRRAQERMKKARPYGEKIRNVAAHMSRAYTEYRHPFLIERDTVKRIGIIVVTSDKGLCGGLNTNVLRMAVSKMKAWEAEGEQIEVCCIGNKGLGFMNRMGANVISHVVSLGDAPALERLIGAIKILLDGYNQDRFDRVYLFYTRFINTMKQEPVMEQLLPLSDERLRASDGPTGQRGGQDARQVGDADGTTARPRPTGRAQRRLAGLKPGHRRPGARQWDDNRRSHERHGRDLP